MEIIKNILLVSLLTTTAFAVQKVPATPKASTATGKPAPSDARAQEATVTDIASPVVGLPQAGGETKLDPKKDVVLYFWATWCPDCKTTLKSKFEGINSEKYQVMAVNSEKDFGRMENFAKKESLPFPVFHDQDKKLQAKYKVFSVPSWVLLSRNGDSWDVKKSGQGESWKTELQ